MRLRALILLLLVHLPLGLAAANPLLGGAPPPRTAETTHETAAPGALGSLGAFVLDAQRRLTRELTEALKAMRDGSSLAPLVAGVFAAFLYGMAHAAGPGHAKGVVLTYFLAREARLGRGFLMGLQIATTHVLAALVIVGLAHLVFDRMFAMPVDEFRAIRLFSYGAIALIGLAMLVQALRRAVAPAVPGGHDHHGHDHHGHDHHGHHHHHRGQGALSALAGMVPCTGAILVLLFAIANNVLVAGFVMVVAIGLGMAAFLALLGVLSILARGRIRRWASGTGGRRSRLAVAVDLAGPLLIGTLGVWLFVDTL